MRAEILAASYLASAALAAAQEAKPREAPTARVVAGPQYGASSFHRMLFGDGYRDVWTTPIQVEVLDLATFSGGLVPKKKGGGKETRSLHFDGADGHEWRFRSVDKDPRAVLPEGLRLGLAESVVRDQISSAFPVSSLVVDPMAEAAGILHVSHRLVVLPDDGRLLGFQKEFAGMLGILEERPRVKGPRTAGFEAYDELVDTEELEKRMDADPADRVDARAYLRARLFDAIVGDYDRHGDQWEWAKNTTSGRFEPFPKDRDLAFVRFDGMAPGLIRMGIPRLVKFDDSYPGPIGLLWQARFIDRRFLAELDWHAWEAEVADLQQRLGKEVIDAAVARMPPPYHARAGAFMSFRLKRRVDLLPDFAWRYYLALAHEVEVHATDEADAVRLNHLQDGSVEVALSGSAGPYFQRTLHPRETHEVWIYAKGGDDRTISEGRPHPGLKVRVIGGDGDDSLDDSAGGDTHFYDSEGENKVVKGPGTHLNTRPYTPPPGDEPPREWGSGKRVIPYIHGDRAYGLLVGFTFERLGYGFRKHPWGTKHSLRLAYSTGLKTGDVAYEFQSRRSDSRGRFDVAAVGATGLDVINYYGFGNETHRSEPRAFHDVQQIQYVFTTGYRLDISSVDLSVGPVVKYSTTRLKSATLLDIERPYGTGDFGQAGARVNFGVNHFDRLLEKPAGLLLASQGTYYAPVWSTTDGFGEVHGLFAAYAKAPIPLKPTLAVRAGGRKTFGRYTLNEAAFIGGRDSVRGLAPQRYAGDSSVYGSAELRLQLYGGERGLINRFGVFGLADGGRVFLAGESSKKWHTAVGGGLWLAFFQPKNCLSVSVAQSEGDRRFYLDVGRAF